MEAPSGTMSAQNGITIAALGAHEDRFRAPTTTGTACQRRRGCASAGAADFGRVAEREPAKPVGESLERQKAGLRQQRPPDGQR